MPLPPRSADVLLATYNGERHLPEQLASLERQTFTGWRLIARDDGSSDATREILAAFRLRHPGAVELVEDADRSLGAAQNFSRLLERSTADYSFFCDQDDVWQPGKMAALLTAAAAQEAPGLPLLVHSDLAVTDAALRVIAPSFWRYQFIRPERCRWQQLLVQNVVTGCACAVNRELRAAALPISGDAIMHDWWLALVAALTGRITWIAEQTVLYRQHAQNDTGAKPWTAAAAANRGGRLIASGGYRARLAAYRRQAAALAKLADDRVPADARAVVRGFAELERRSYVHRVRFLLRHGILKTGAARNAALLAWI